MNGLYLFPFLPSTSLSLSLSLSFFLFFQPMYCSKLVEYIYIYSSRNSKKINSPNFTARLTKDMFSIILHFSLFLLFHSLLNTSRSFTRTLLKFASLDYTESHSRFNYNAKNALNWFTLLVLNSILNLYHPRYY